MTDEKYGILIAGHGSKLPYNRQLAEKMAEMVSARMPGAVVRVGFMNVNSPSIADALKGFEGTGIKDIVVFPLFLERGVHVIDDIPGVLGLENGERHGVYNGLNVHYADPIGADELLVRLVCKRVGEARLSQIADKVS